MNATRRTGAGGLLRALLERAALVLLGLLLAGLLAEGVLRIAAAFVSAPVGVVNPPLFSGRKRIVCMGDSNTYGL
jgi:hypothetical protein